MKPTTFPTAVATAVPTPAQELLVQAPLDTGAIALRPEQVPQAEQALAALDFAAIPSGDIIKIGLGAEQALQKTLDGFLARLDTKTASKVFALFGRLEKGVDDAKLPEILEKIQEGEDPGFFAGLFAKFTGRKPEEAFSEFMQEVGDLISSRTRTLADEMGRLEGELSKEMKTLFGELQALESLKQSYGTHFASFTVDAAVARAFLEKARQVVAEQTAAASPADMTAQARLRELQDKLRLLESRALALEGTYTRLPADQMVIQQIEAAGIATLQETATTVSSRFASIKMTLLAIHGAFAVKSVQQIAERQARLDQQLTQLRGQATKDVAVAAARAPGDNRVAQAQQIAAIITQTREIHDLVEAAKQETEAKFETARQMFEQSRAELVALRKA
ncbi:hypothetical protein [uncultured Aquimonas sp.]|uniref:hypothetical protein n=1 Tax=uncultured Aquimonas sp. TaxID=385483 RepID=UPI0026126D37|nr:hypothetical protein [uncultured Aquimonas sp.]